MSDNGRVELARRLRRIFLSQQLDDGGRAEVPDETLLNFAEDILAGDYFDPAHGPRPGDGGPAMKLTVVDERRVRDDPDVPQWEERRGRA